MPSGASVRGKDGADVSANYFINYVNGALTVNKPQAVPAKVTANNWTYDGKQRPLVVVDGAAADGTMRYSLDGKTYSAEIPCVADAGAYTVWYKAAGDENHSDSEPSSVSATVASKGISAAKVTLNQTSYTYNGKAKKPAVKTVNGETLKAGTDYTVSYKSNVNVGKATVTVTGKGNYSGTSSATFKIGKAANKLTVKTAKKTVKASKKARKVSSIKKAKPKYAAKVTFKKATTAKAKKMSGYKALSVNKKTGKVTVKAGTYPGTYKLMVKATAAKTANTKAVSKTVTVTVKVVW